ncbi:hypothetical protein LZ554_007059 [Drepanopeziza brunnea f. sp. 'monogermtubi']|nr:hypothetical protein LZ554_007059 [Drepanopeziza brunnea f. sp. 'monogermtubi']
MAAPRTPPIIVLEPPLHSEQLYISTPISEEHTITFTRPSTLKSFKRLPIRILKLTGLPTTLSLFVAEIHCNDLNIKAVRTRCSEDTGQYAICIERRRLRCVGQWK